MLGSEKRVIRRFDEYTDANCDRPGVEEVDEKEKPEWRRQARMDEASPHSSRPGNIQLAAWCVTKGLCRRLAHSPRLIIPGVTRER